MLSTLDDFYNWYSSLKIIFLYNYGFEALLNTLSYIVKKYKIIFVCDIDDQYTKYKYSRASLSYIWIWIFNNAKVFIQIVLDKWVD